MNKYYFRIVCKNSFKYFYYKNLPKDIINDNNYCIYKLKTPIDIIQFTKQKKLKSVVEKTVNDNLK